MVRGKDPIRHHVRRQVRQSVMVNPGPAHKIPDSPTPPISQAAFALAKVVQQIDRPRAKRRRADLLDPQEALRFLAHALPRPQSQRLPPRPGRHRPQSAHRRRPGPINNGPPRAPRRRSAHATPPDAPNSSLNHPPPSPFALNTRISQRSRISRDGAPSVSGTFALPGRRAVRPSRSAMRTFRLTT